MISDHRYGRLAETMAAWALRLRGYRIVGRNVRVAGREVDLVARRGDLLVVCEVKARRGRSFGGPAAAVGARTQHRLREAAELLASRDPGAQRVRVDVITVEGFTLRHLPGALPAV
ncbi:MAG TPA: YraN family protein [Gaiellales bacterium]|nr:YraN family protein [Gaiellales bacterium]